jgi:hypothetical protein
MTDASTQDHAAPVSDTPAPDAAAPEQASAAPAQDIDNLLSEFDAGVKPEPADDPAAIESLMDDTARAEEAAYAAGANFDAAYYVARNDQLADLNNRFNGLMRYLDDQADGQAIMAQASEAIADVDGLPPNFIERFLASEYHINAELKQAWDNRYASAEHQDHFKWALKHTLKKLSKEARDAAALAAGSDVYESRMAVAAAMRGGSGSPPPSKPPDIGKMSDAEFRQYGLKQFGYDPL